MSELRDPRAIALDIFRSHAHDTADDVVSESGIFFCGRCRDGVAEAIGDARRDGATGLLEALRAAREAQAPAAGVDAFHAHLDACERCRNRPFDLCSTGASLLERSVSP